MGRNYLVRAMIIGAAASILAPLAIAQIALPSNPNQVRVPVSNPDDEFQRQLDKKKHSRSKRNKKIEKPKEDAIVKRDRKLLEESLEKRPIKMHLTAGVVYPYAFVKGQRREYVFDPSIYIKAFFRWKNEPNTLPFQIWYGFRYISINGTGIYENIPGRFGFSYYGPMIGVGSVDPAPASSGKDSVKKLKEGKKKSVESIFKIRSGAFFVAGLAMHSRFTKINRGTETPGEDFNEVAIGLDPPGIWGEASYSWIHFGSLAINFMSGVQMGAGKTFVYFGGGIGGYH